MATRPSASRAAGGPTNGFDSRANAGRGLAQELRAYCAEHPIVLALPRGGVPVGYEIAQALNAPLDVWVVRKVGVPWYPELGIGAVAEGGYVYLNQDILDHVVLSRGEVVDSVRSKQREVQERVRLFRGARPAPTVRDRTVILVDDGIATGGTVRAAIRSLRARGPKAIVLAVPVATPELIRSLEFEVEHCVCLQAPSELYAIGVFYEDFREVSGDDVLRLLDRAWQERASETESVA